MIRALQFRLDNFIIFGGLNAFNPITTQAWIKEYVEGKNVTALLAIETTELEISIPGLDDGSKIHVVIWDNKNNKKSEETGTYKAPYKQMLKEYDFILIDKVN